MEEASTKSKDPLNCPLCLNTFRFNTPRSLPCLHTFCQGCLTSVIEKGNLNDRFQCPSCKVVTSAPNPDLPPEDWASSFPTNHIVISLLEKDGKGGSSGPGYQLCSHDGEDATVYCEDCKKLLCEKCHNQHKVIKSSKDHKVITNLSKKGIPSNVSADKAMFMCSLHGEVLEYHCQDHNALCCSKCAIVTHRKCERVIIIEDAAKGAFEVRDVENNKAAKALVTLKYQYEKLKENRELNLLELSTFLDKINQSIQDWRERIIQIVDRLVHTAMEELGHAYKEETVKLTDGLEECKRSLAGISSTREILGQTLTQSSEPQIFITFNKVMSQIGFYEAMLKTLVENATDVKLVFEWNHLFEKELETHKSIGKPALKTASLTVPKNPRRLLRNTIQNKNALLSPKEKECDITAGAFLPDGRLVLLDFRNGNSKLFDSSFNFVTSLQFRSSPLDICLANVNQVAITFYDKQMVRIISVNESALQMVSFFNTEGRCYGITCFEEELYVAVKKANQLEVHVFNVAGNRRRKIRTTFDTLFYPYIALSPWGRRMYISGGLEYFLCTNMDAAIQWKTNENGYKGFQGVNVDQEGYIYCCSKTTHCLVRVSPDGKEHKELLGKDDGIHLPWRAILNVENDKLVLCEERCPSFRVYNLKQ
ncbi:hypothetical protein CHS0354_029647 [Potamilus streckersoni]|uniref:Uncharacterized protein n=1 Tax=Potamilus streckersoni TaxID=2493646 RepID=A0AAE0RTE7_9BIVA|nr:hypothetical protein CHS0354_029647 [Potamilus streckersoni]